MYVCCKCRRHPQTHSLPVNGEAIRTGIYIRAAKFEPHLHCTIIMIVSYRHIVLCFVTYSQNIVLQIDERKSGNRHLII